MSKLERNAPCPCGSGKKYKRCCEPRRKGALPSVAPFETEAGEPHFTVELSPQVERKVDRLLARLERGEREDLQAELLALAKQHPHQHLPLFGLGVYQLLVNDDPAAALPFFQRAVEIYPYFAEGHYNLAGCATKQGDIRKAVESLRKTIRYTNDADIASRAREQLKVLESIVTKDGLFATLDAYMANQATFEKAFEALARNDFEPAAEGFRKVLEQNPDHVQSYGNLGLAYAGLGRKAAALECLDKALALDPAYAPARSNRHLIETMKEGRPHMMHIAETRFYREQLEAERTDRSAPPS
jgi:tetratricopeptide (TPR) repeat protein